MARIIEGTWEEIEQRKDEFTGKQLRITVVDEILSEEKKSANTPESWGSVQLSKLNHYIDFGPMGIYG